MDIDVVIISTSISTLLLNGFCEWIPHIKNEKQFISLLPGTIVKYNLDPNGSIDDNMIRKLESISESTNTETEQHSEKMKEVEAGSSRVENAKNVETVDDKMEPILVALSQLTKILQSGAPITPQIITLQSKISQQIELYLSQNDGKIDNRVEKLIKEFKDILGLRFKQQAVAPSAPQPKQKQKFSPPIINHPQFQNFMIPPQFVGALPYQFGNNFANPMGIPNPQSPLMTPIVGPSKKQFGKEKNSPTRNNNSFKQQRDNRGNRPKSEKPQPLRQSPKNNNNPVMESESGNKKNQIRDDDRPNISKKRFQREGQIDSKAKQSTKKHKVYNDLDACESSINIDYGD